VSQCRDPPKPDFSVSAETETGAAYVHRNRSRNRKWASKFGWNRSQNCNCIFTPEQTRSYCAKFHEKWIKITAVEVFTDRMTVWQKWFH